MKPLPHHYFVRLDAGPTGYARLSGDGLPDLLAAPPLDFDGPGDVWTPEHLFLAALETCFALTFRAVARAAQLEYRGLDVTCDGVVDRVNGRLRFVEVIVRPRIALGRDVDRQRVLRVVDRSEHACLISASVGVPVRVEPHLEWIDDLADARSA